MIKIAKITAAVIGLLIMLALATSDFWRPCSTYRWTGFMHVPGRCIEGLKK
jgi:hypothetical protein